MTISNGLSLRTGGNPAAIVFFAAFYSCIGVMPLPALANDRITPDPGFKTCIRTFWDQHVYGWYSYENNCSVPVHLTFCDNLASGSGSCGGMELGVGKHNSTGDSPDDMRANHGGSYWEYPCPLNYNPIDGSTGRIVHSSLSPLSYYCQAE